MTVLGITTAASPSQSNLNSRPAQARLAYRALGEALADGKLEDAAAALKTLQEQIRGGGQGKSQNPDNAKQLLSALATVLKSVPAAGGVEEGETEDAALKETALAEARELYAQLQKNTEVRGKGHHKAGRSGSEDTVTVGGVQLPPATPEVPPAETPISGAGTGEIDVMA
jgi:hypothetical protein